MSDIEKVIKRGEGKNIEFKSKLPKGDGFVKTVISFSNMAGGKIFIGLEDKTGKVVGISESDVLDLPDRISNIIYDSCYPTIIPEIYVIHIKNTPILIVEIYPGSSKPYYLKSKGKHRGTFIRVGATNKNADTEMLLELERQRRNISFDEEAEPGTDENDIDFSKIQVDFFEYTGRKLSPKDLHTLKLLTKQSGTVYPTKGGLLIAGKNTYFEYSRIKCARFKGNDMAEFIDQKEFSGPLYEQIENAMKFAKIYIAKSGRVVELQRIDKYEIPIEAIREILVNAVVHRDYSISGSDVKFAIFDDRIEITSPGALPKALEIDDIYSGRSEIRNRVIARFLKEIHFIEQWGTGVGKVLMYCQKAGLKEPEFKENGLFFKVVLYKNKIVEAHADEKMPLKTQKISQKISQKTSQKTSQKISQKTSQKTSQKKMITLLKKNPSVTIGEMAKTLEVSDRTIKTYITELKREGKLKRIGPDKGGYWEIIE